MLCRLQKLTHYFQCWPNALLAQLCAELYQQNKDLHARLRQLSADVQEDTNSLDKPTIHVRTAGERK